MGTRSKPEIPRPLTAYLSLVLSRYNTHSSLDIGFQMHGAPGESPGGSKEQKCRQWLDRAALDTECDALALVGGLLAKIMDQAEHEGFYDAEKMNEVLRKDKVEIAAQLARHGLGYVTGGSVVRIGKTASPTRSLQDILRQGDFPGVDREFQRAIETVESDPAAALTAACAILESLFEIVIEDDGLVMPSRKSVGPLWGVIRSHLEFDPGTKDDDDIKKILQGLASIVDGIGALRTHAGSAHGRDGRKQYKVQPRHGRLAIHAAHTLTVFVIETWNRKRQGAARV